MQAIIDVFRMSEISVKTRISILKKLGHVVNREHGANVTEMLIYELVLALDPNNEIATDEKYTDYL